jgi:hypothetical protein
VQSALLLPLRKAIRWSTQHKSLPFSSCAPLLTFPVRTNRSVRSRSDCALPTHTVCLSHTSLRLPVIRSRPLLRTTGVHPSAGSEIEQMSQVRSCIWIPDREGVTRYNDDVSWRRRTWPHCTGRRKWFGWHSVVVRSRTLARLFARAPLWARPADPIPPTTAVTKIIARKGPI